MIRELQIIFGLDTVPGKLRVTRHALIFLQELCRISALALVAAVATTPARHAARCLLLRPATATAATLAIIDQIRSSLVAIAPFQAARDNPTPCWWLSRRRIKAR